MDKDSEKRESSSRFAETENTNAKYFERRNAQILDLIGATPSEVVINLELKYAIDNKDEDKVRELISKMAIKKQMNVETPARALSLRSDEISPLYNSPQSSLDSMHKGWQFPPARTKGSISNKTKYIHKLATDNPDKKAKELYPVADKKIIGSMLEGTFANHVSTARNTKF